MSAVAPLQITEVSHQFGGKTVLRNVSLELEPNSIVCLIGESGSGKSTLLRIVAGLLKPTHGRIAIGGHDVTGKAPQRRDLGLIFQDLNALFPHMTVQDNVRFALQHGRRKGFEGNASEALGKILHLTRLEFLRHRRMGALSGGEKQRVALARTLIFNPKVILFDEPLSSLDNSLRRDVLDLIGHLHSQLGGAYLYVTHDEREASYISTHVAVLDQAHIVQFGRTNEVLSNPSSPRVARLLGDWSLNTISAEMIDKWAGGLFAPTSIPIPSRDLVDTSMVQLGNRVSSTTISVEAPKGPEDPRTFRVDGTVARAWPWYGRWRAIVRLAAGNIEGEAIVPLSEGQQVGVSLTSDSYRIWVGEPR